MANKVVSEKYIKAVFMTENGKEYNLTIERPDPDLTDAQIFSAMTDFKNCGIIKPDGTSLATIKSIKMVETEQTTYDLVALAEE